MLKRHHLLQKERHVKGCLLNYIVFHGKLYLGCNVPGGLMRIVLLTIVLLYITATAQTGGKSDNTKELWLTVEKTGDVVTILNQQVVAGKFKKDRRKDRIKKNQKAFIGARISDFCYRVLDENGTLLEEIYLINPNEIHVHTHSHADEGDTEPSQHKNAGIFLVKIPISVKPARIDFIKVPPQQSDTHHSTPIATKSSVPTQTVLGSFKLDGF